MEHVERAKELVYDRIRNTYPKHAAPIPTFDVFVVWACHILGYEKFLLSTTIPNGKYFEVTYDAERDKYYIDEYVKVYNEEV